MRARSLRQLATAALALLALLLFTPVASAARIGIDTGNDPGSRLEIRTLTLPGGEELQLYVLTGERLRVSIDDALLEATHVEVDLTNRLVRVIGEGRYTAGGEVVVAEDLLIDLREESFSGDDVLIISDGMEVRGDRASRVPGLIRVALGEFSPCTRCGQEIEDYGFKAESLEIYPGDRLVAFAVTVLVRGSEVGQLPLLVLPVGPPDRRPRFEYVRGTANDRARILLSWPYVMGPNAYGDFGLRYYADVQPGSGGAGDFFLGGAVEESYLGGYLFHRFYTDRGKGVFSVDLTPGFVSPGGREEPQFKVRLSYGDEEVLGPPSTSLLIERDDARRLGLWEATVTQVGESTWVRGQFSSQFYLGGTVGAAFTTPSYASRTIPLMTPLRLELTPADGANLNLGPLRVERALLDLGAFQDRSNTLNRSAARNPVVLAGRVREGHRLRLTLPLWSGVRLDGITDFTGYYYSTAERQVEWLTRLSLEQQFGRNGALSLAFTRDVREGETPFRFDLFPYRARTDLRGRLSLTPLPWLAFEQTGGYVFVDNRNPDALGPEPLKSTLKLLGNLNWISLTLSNEYDLKEPDPGTLDATLELRSRGPLTARLEVKHSHDLAVKPDRLTGEPHDSTATTLKASVALPDVVELSVEGGYRYYPLEASGGGPPDHFDDLRVKLTLGTLKHGDSIPGLAVTYARDLNVGEASAFEVAAALSIGPLEFDAEHRLTLPSGRLARSKLRLAWPGALAVQADGLDWLPTGWLGFPTPDPYARNVTFAVEEAPARGRPDWQVRYSTRLEPMTGAGGEYDRVNSQLSGRLLVLDKSYGEARFSVDAFAELMWRDSRQPTTYLRRANVQFGVELYERVGLQGRLGYTGQYSATEAEVVSGVLTLQEVALVVRPLDSLYLGAIIDDVWELTGNDPSRPAFNLQPKFVIVWNRCCWALHGSWNSATGAVAIALTTPGADQGLSNVFDTGWIIPRREP